MHFRRFFRSRGWVALCLLLLFLFAGCSERASKAPHPDGSGQSSAETAPIESAGSLNGGTASIEPSKKESTGKSPAPSGGEEPPFAGSSAATESPTPDGSASKPSASWESPTPTPDPTAFSARSEGDGGTVAVWWWDKGKAARLNRGRYLDFLEKNCVNEIYICWPDFKSEQLASFVRDAGERGMAVSLLSGDASWIDPQNNGADAVINDFLAYQKKALPEERLLSLHMDVEPHQREDFSSNRQEILQWYADFVKKTAEKVQGQDERIGWDIPFWFDEFAVLDENGKETPLLCHLAKHADTLCLMSYRDSAEAVLECAKRELQLAEEYGCQIICGVETHSAEGDHVSFMEEGKEYMASETGKLYLTLREMMPKDQYGIAFHYLDTWYKLQD